MTAKKAVSSDKELPRFVEDKTELTQFTEVFETALDDITPYANNAKVHKDNATLIANSISSFGFRYPILVDSTYTIISGHGRYEAARLLHLDKVPVMIARDLTQTQVKALRLADNKVSEAKFDDDALQAELELLESSDYDMADFGFTDSEDLLDDEKYTIKTDIPQYEPTDSRPELSDLLDTTKAESLKQSIAEADVPDDIKAFLTRAAERHTVYRYDRIADYYTNAPADVQALFEEALLVIVDVNSAIAGGYATFNEEVVEQLYDQGHDIRLGYENNEQTYEVPDYD